MLYEIEKHTGNAPWTLEQQERVRRAVQDERERVVQKEVAPPKDEAGRKLKEMLDMEGRQPQDALAWMCETKATRHTGRRAGSKSSSKLGTSSIECLR